MPNGTKDDRLDTGTGGFPDTNGNRVTYDVGVDSSTTSTQQWSSGQINVDSSPRDLSVGTKKTLAHYMSKTTLGATPSAGSSAPNKYPVQHGNTEPLSVTLNNPATGVPVGPQKSSNNSVHASSYIPGDDRSVIFEEAKAKSKKDGHSLLRDYTPVGRSAIATREGFTHPISSRAPDPESPINAYYGNDKKQISNSVIYNRFNNDIQFEQYTLDGTPGERIGRPQFSAKYEYGQSMSPDDPNRSVTYGRLAQLGSSLSLRAGVELGSLDNGFNPTSSTTQAAAILPGVAQLSGIERKERDTLDAEKALSELTQDGISDALLIDPGRLTWGTLNNVQDQFSGISNFGMQLLAAALVVGLGVLIGAFAAIAVLFGGSGSTTQVPDKGVDALGRRPYGQFYAQGEGGGDYSGVSGILKAILSGKFSFWRFLGMSKTLNETGKCIATGVLAFFGVTAPNTTPLGILAKSGDIAQAATASPGYYSVMARSVTRSFLLISDGFQSLGKAFDSGLTAGIKQLFEVIDVIRSSKFMKSLNIFAALGDKIIINSVVPDQLDKDADNISSYVKHKSIIDNKPNVDAASKSRLNVSKGANISGLALAWSAYRAPDLMIMPAGILGVRNGDVASKLGTPSLSGKIPNERDGVEGGVKGGYHVTSADVSRIPTELREKMEDALESEYVPFYIHDVRTNEIVSFHAFLMSLSDDYTAAYETTEGFGRVEPVKIYKSTTRRIGFSFMLAATSPNDFDYMWMKINKLATMVYPQYSEGRSLTSKDGKTSIQVPFSQTIQASPLVRLRIGDLIKTNYSRFNLARLFGYGTDGTVFDNKKYTPTQERKDIIKAQTLELMKASGTKMFLAGGALDKYFMYNSTGAEDVKSLPPGFVLVSKGSVTESEKLMIQCEVKVATAEDTTPGIGEGDLYLYQGGGGDAKDLTRRTYLIPVENLVLAPSSIKKIKLPADAAPTVDYVNAATSFVDDDLTKGNAIVKSFRSAGGKGLAGFIETLSFDWYDRVTWEIGHGTSDEISWAGRRAPKMCKVTVGFSPVHDISPGIDHMGFNRAAVYPVGPHYAKDFSTLAGAPIK